jgi:2-polyprenyl-3-methyl-5-hydroxy-6-metoxy-1,4-benzoquinol methylase
MIHQDNFYLETESNAFFDRWYISNETNIPTELRATKKEILDMIEKSIDVESLSVLEVGCFIGDLLGFLKNERNCEVFGIESSSKACKFAKDNFNVEIENATFLKSKLFRLDESNFQKFDLIICDDVLSWVSRDLILSTLGVLDWMLKPGGSIYIRDFSPTFAFAYENHHWPGEQIYNFKQASGHRQFFLQTGKYLETTSFIRTDSQYQQVKTDRPDSMTWSDSLLTKIENTLHPKIKI